MNFREDLTPEARFPRRRLIGNPVNRGNGTVPSLLTILLFLAIVAQLAIRGEKQGKE